MFFSRHCNGLTDYNFTYSLLGIETSTVKRQDVIAEITISLTPY